MFAKVTWLSSQFNVGTVALCNVMSEQYSAQDNQMYFFFPERRAAGACFPCFSVIRDLRRVKDTYKTTEHLIGEPTLSAADIESPAHGFNTSAEF